MIDLIRNEANPNDIKKAFTNDEKVEKYPDSMETCLRCKPGFTMDSSMKCVATS
jgi:hypothetical protein